MLILILLCDKRNSYNLGSYKISSTFRAIYDIKRGGKAPWIIQINPHFDSTPNVDSSIKYGCVLTDESTKTADIYTEISRWAAGATTVVQEPRKVLHVYLNVRKTNGGKSSPLFISKRL
jgi:hypothetical protein